MGHPSQDLTALVETVGGVPTLALYLDLPEETLEIALAARAGDRTDRVSRMVAENTWKLAGMPSQGGFFWRITRRRVVKDWLILARWSAANGGQPQGQEEEEDEAVRLRVQVLTERFDELWESSANPMMRESADSPPGDLEQALIRYVGNTASAAFAMDAIDNDAEPDEAQMEDEMQVLTLIAAGGYVWRAAERETLPELPSLREVTFAVKWMNDHPNKADTERFERLAKAIFWTLSSGGSLALPDDSQVNGEAVLGVGFHLVAGIICERAGFDPDTMLVGDDVLTGDDGMRSAFKAGVALRELEPHIAS